MNMFMYIVYWHGHKYNEALLEAVMRKNANIKIKISERGRERERVGKKTVRNVEHNNARRKRKY